MARSIRPGRTGGPAIQRTSTTILLSVAALLGAAGTALGMDTVSEFRVEANAYSAEFGRNVGGQVNVLTKSGTNQFSGSAFEYHRNDALG